MGILVLMGQMVIWPSWPTSIQSITIPLLTQIQEILFL